MATWLETFKGAVLVSEYDSEAHMNSQMYVSRFDQATWFLLQAIGLTPASVRRQKLRVAIVRQNFQYLRELKGGELVMVRSGFLGVGRKHVRFVHQMLDYESKALIATSDCTATQASLASGKSVPLADGLKKKAQSLLVTVESAPSPAERPARKPVRRAAAR